MAWYSGNIYEQYLMWNRMFGPYWYMYWALLLFNMLVPQVLWFRAVRTNVVALFVIAICRQYRHVAGALRHRGGQPCTAISCRPPGECIPPPSWDYGVFVGSIGLFFAAVVSFCPVLADDLDLRDARAGARHGGTEMTLTETERSRQPAIYGLMAEFDGPEALLEAAQRAYAEGYRRMDAYSPFPVDGLAEAIGFHRTRLAFVGSDRRHRRLHRRAFTCSIGFR